MSGYKEFEGKTLDEAIRAACSFYDTSREKLEIEICNDAKGGIFGLVGAKKARVRAKMVEFSSVLDGLETPLGNARRQKKRSGPQGAGQNANQAGEGDKPRQERRASSDEHRSAKREDAPEPRREKREDPTPKERGENHRKQPPADRNGERGGDRGNDRGYERGNERGSVLGAPSVAELFARESTKDAGKNAKDATGSSAKGGKGRERGRRNRQDKENGKSKPDEASFINDAADLDSDADDLDRVPFDQLDPVALESAAREIVTRLTEPFLGESAIAVTITSDRVRVSISGVEDPGLLIGRDGQNLASLQYLVTRMLSNRMKALLRVQIDAGDYRERQDERLRELAFSLAEKVKAGGRPQVTRPLSSYHRRVIHLALQEDPLIQTHSKGDGEMKRVMVAKKKQ